MFADPKPSRCGMPELKKVFYDLENATDVTIKIPWYNFKYKIAPKTVRHAILSKIVGTSDIYYLPRSKLDVFYNIGSVFLKRKVFCEIAVPRIGAVSGWDGFYFNHSRDLSGLDLWNERGKWAEVYDSTKHYIHPVKMSGLGKNLNHRACFCQSYIKSFFQALNVL